MILAFTIPSLEQEEAFMTIVLTVLGCLAILGIIVWTKLFPTKNPGGITAQKSTEPSHVTEEPDTRSDAQKIHDLAESPWFNPSLRKGDTSRSRKEGL